MSWHPLNLGVSLATAFTAAADRAPCAPSSFVMCAARINQMDVSERNPRPLGLPDLPACATRFQRKEKARATERRIPVARLQHGEPPACASQSGRHAGLVDPCLSPSPGLARILLQAALPEGAGLEPVGGVPRRPAQSSPLASRLRWRTLVAVSFLEVQIGVRTVSTVILT